MQVHDRTDRLDRAGLQTMVRTLGDKASRRQMSVEQGLQSDVLRLKQIIEEMVRTMDVAVSQRQVRTARNSPEFRITHKYVSPQSSVH